MRPIEVFYHFYIPPDIRSGMWPWWIDQQLSLIRDFKLSSAATVNMAITMPMFWTELGGLPIFKNKSHNQSFYTNELGQILSNNPKIPELNFFGKVSEYIALRYPFVNIVDVRDVGQPNIFEGQTLKKLWDRCRVADIDVLYLHNKGVTSASASVANWRDVLNHYHITEWVRCVKALEQFDVVGVKDLVSMNMTTSGNFFWSKSEYIRQLPEPVASDVYIPDKSEFHPGQPGYRYAFERWAMTGNPRYYPIVDTGTDHFTTYCFLENLRQN